MENTLAQVAALLKNPALNIIQYPSGRWGFVGKVPHNLAFECSKQEYIDIACNHGVGIAEAIAKNEGGIFKSRSFETLEAAQAAMEGV